MYYISLYPQTLKRKIYYFRVYFCNFFTDFPPLNVKKNPFFCFYRNVQKQELQKQNLNLQKK